MDNVKEYSGDCEYCVICGAPVPEGAQVCVNCAKIYEDEQGAFDYED